MFAPRPCLFASASPRAPTGPEQRDRERSPRRPQTRDGDSPRAVERLRPNRPRMISESALKELRRPRPSTILWRGSSDAIASCDTSARTAWCLPRLKVRGHVRSMAQPFSSGRVFFVRKRRQTWPGGDHPLQQDGPSIGAVNTYPARSRNQSSAPCEPQSRAPQRTHGPSPFGRRAKRPLPSTRSSRAAAARATFWRGLRERPYLRHTTPTIGWLAESSGEGVEMVRLGRRAHGLGHRAPA